MSKYILFLRLNIDYINMYRSYHVLYTIRMLIRSVRLPTLGPNSRGTSSNTKMSGKRGKGDLN